MSKSRLTFLPVNKLYDCFQMDCTNKPIFLFDNDYNFKVDVCSKGLADQFADTTGKIMTTDELGNLVLLSLFKRERIPHLTDVDVATGFLNFPYKGRQYMVLIVGKTVSVKLVFIAGYEDRTVFYTLDDAKQLCAISYDCQNNVILLPVNKKLVSQLDWKFSSRQ